METLSEQQNIPPNPEPVPDDKPVTIEENNSTEQPTNEISQQNENQQNENQQNENQQNENQENHKRKDKIRRVKRPPRKERGSSDGALVRRFMSFIKRQSDLAKPRPPREPKAENATTDNNVITNNGNTIENSNTNSNTMVQPTQPPPQQVTHIEATELNFSLH